MFTQIYSIQTVEEALGCVEAGGGPGRRSGWGCPGENSPVPSTRRRRQRSLRP